MSSPQTVAVTPDCTNGRHCWVTDPYCNASEPYAPCWTCGHCGAPRGAQKAKAS